mgnify:CR=1 FL=1
MKCEIESKGKRYPCEWFDDTNFEKLKNVVGVAGFLFDKNGKLCIVRTKSKGHWTLVGGRVEKEDKSFEDTLIREADEEADIEIEDIKRIGFMKSVSPQGEINNSPRFVGKIKRINPQTIDIAESEITERKLIDPEDFDKHTKWGENGTFQLNKALEKLNKK